jgi:thioredoxin 1
MIICSRINCQLPSFHRQKAFKIFSDMDVMKAKLMTILAVVALLACAAAFAGSLGKAQQTQQQVQPVIQGKVTMDDIDNALVKGPVFIEFETAECGYCKQQKPISQQLEKDYAGKVVFFFVDANENPGLAKAFLVRMVPQMDVVASKSDGKYTYIDKDGAPSDSVSASRFMGSTDRDTLKKALDGALAKRT